MLPRCSTPLGDTGSANTDDELHEPAAGAAMRGSQTALLNHCVGEPRIDGSPTRSGRSDVTPVSVLSVVITFSGLPDWNCRTPVTCQPSNRRLPWNGSSYVPLRLKRCRVSKSDGPSLSARLVLSCSEPFALAPVLSYELVSVDFDSVYDVLT